MAVVESPNVDAPQPAPSRTRSTWYSAKVVLRPFASLKVTVVLFALAIFITLVGTLAQVDEEMWEVMENYFYPWLARIDAAKLIPRTWVPQLDGDQKAALCSVFTLITGGISAVLIAINSKGANRWLMPAAVVWLCAYIAVSCWLIKGFYFPGGASIGLAMAVNLIAAHLVRFGLQAKGTQLFSGVLVSGCGVALIAGVIINGHNHEGLQGEPPFSWPMLWTLVKLSISTCAIGGIAWLAVQFGKDKWRTPQVLVFGIVIACTAMTAAYLWATGERSYLGDSGMRVLWQLIQASIAAAVFCAGCLLLFKRRAGIVALHAGVLLMMFGQWFVAQYDVEEQITVWEGETVDWAHDIRRVELAVIDREASADMDSVVAIPLTANGQQSHYLAAGNIDDDWLPFSIEFVDYLTNSTLDDQTTRLPAKATKGHGTQVVATAARDATGTDSSVNQASAYVRLTQKESGADLGTYLLSQVQWQQGRGPMTSIVKFDTETVEVGGKEYDLQLRFKRNYKPYSLNLVNVSREDYVGTDTPRAYTSVVRLKDESQNFDRELKIWMNNPKRYAGETFYQSGYMPFGNKEATTLQVVRNSGWMIPYVSCVVVGEGMLIHFLYVLLRFLGRRSSAQTLARWGLFSGGVVGLVALTLSASRKRQADDKPLVAKRTRKKKAPAERFEIGGGTDTNRGVIGQAIAAFFPWIMLALSATFLYSMAKGRPEPADGLAIKEFGALPLLYEGRAKPFDTLARNSLRIISGRESFKARYDQKTLAAKWPRIEKKLKGYWSKLSDQDLDKYKNDIPGLIDFIEERTNANRQQIVVAVDKYTCETQPAIRWLLDVASGALAAREHKVFRIDNEEVLDTLDLQRRKGYRYSLEEIWPGMPEFEKQRVLAFTQAKSDPTGMSIYQRKLLEVAEKFALLQKIRGAFMPPVLPPLPNADDFRKDQQLAARKIQQFQQQMQTAAQDVMALKPPLCVYDGKTSKWVPYANSWAEHYVLTQLLGEEPQPSFSAINKTLVNYLQAVEGSGDERKMAVSVFNREVRDYHRYLQDSPPKELQAQDSLLGNFVKSRFGTFYRFESFFNQCSPFFWCSFLYVLAFSLAALGWLGWVGPLNRAAFLIILFTFVVHTIALGARIYISGRPPVTNLYSSAVFIGWGSVLLLAVFELIFRNGVSNVLAGAAGFASLVVANALAGDGDTFVVLQAVLDTQFWLATHVVCITIGYATTYVAGGLGIVFVARNLLDRSFNSASRRELERMIYGTICFSIFFSFIGTVLGGLWADDSWGRFWGWDPKENGALIIVLWNALVLHAKWDGLAKGRGLALLAVGGNIVTAWSWFGVNELGVGLHSYGFTEGVLRNLSLFVASQLVVMALAAVPFRALEREPLPTGSTA